MGVFGRKFVTLGGFMKNSANTLSAAITEPLLTGRGKIAVSTRDTKCNASYNVTYTTECEYYCTANLNSTPADPKPHCHDE